MLGAVPPPESEAELLLRARRLAGLPLSELAAAQGRAVPERLERAKGFVGALLEGALGASAGTSPGPDFPSLGVELKTLPVDGAGRPCESTFVCTAPLGARARLSFADSPVRAKLARVLWVPVEGDRAVPVAARRVGTALLWSPTPEQEAELGADWDELSPLLVRGDAGAVSARLGRHLQLRPKAASSRVLGWGADDEGEEVRTSPRGFYLRASFTRAVLAAGWVLPAPR